MKKLIALFIATILILSGLVIQTSAAVRLEDLCTVSIIATVTYQPCVFSVSLPSALPIAIDENGVVYSATNLRIANNSSVSVYLADVELTSTDEWTIADYGKLPEGELRRYIGYNINGCVTKDQKLIFNRDKFETVSCGNTLYMTYSANPLNRNSEIPPQKTADIVFIIGWNIVPRNIG